MLQLLGTAIHNVDVDVVPPDSCKAFALDPAGGLPSPDPLIPPTLPSRSAPGGTFDLVMHLLA